MAARLGNPAVGALFVSWTSVQEAYDHMFSEGW